MRKKGSSSAICVEEKGMRRADGGRQRPSMMLHVSVWRQGHWGAEPDHIFPAGKSSTPKQPCVPTISYTPASPRPSETSWGIGACLERDKPLPEQQLLGQARKSSPKRGSEMSHPSNPPKSRVCAHLGEDVDTSGHSLRDLTFSGHR